MNTKKKHEVPAVEIVGETCIKPLPKVKKVFSSDGKSMWYETSEHCSLYPNHNTRADGSCIREDFCPGRNDPKCLVKGGEKMGKKKTVKREAEEAIKNAAKEAPEAHAEYDFLAALKAIDHPASSREVSDKLGISDPDKGRGLVRREMEKLIADKKVATVEPEGKTRVSKLYKLA